MYKPLFFFLLLTLAFLPACHDHGTDGPVTDFGVTFKANYDGQTLEKDHHYQFGNYPLFFSRYRLYLSDITLINSSGETVISEAEYLDFTPENAPSATPTLTFKNVPEGHYTSIRLGYGVKPSNNAKQPSNFPAGSPLAIEEDYWIGWHSYIFSVLDGKYDPDNNGTDWLNFSYHSGSDAVYKVFTFDQDIHVESGGKGATIIFDVKKLLTQPDGSLYDIEANPFSSNSTSDVRVANDIMSGYERATSIEQ